MTCKHHYIRTWVFEDTEQPSGLWSCVDCSLKFEPITQRTAAVGEDSKEWVGLTDEEVMEMMGYDKQYGYIPQYARNFVEAISAKLKEKNT